jgi:hypothetical protein
MKIVLPARGIRAELRGLSVARSARRPRTGATPAEITYRSVPASAAVVSQVLRGLARLARLDPRVVRCRLTIGRPAGRARKGNLFHVRVDLSTPGKDVAATRSPTRGRAGESLATVVDDAFARMRARLLEARRATRRMRKAAGRLART